MTEKPKEHGNSKEIMLLRPYAVSRQVVRQVKDPAVREKGCCEQLQREKGLSMTICQTFKSDPITFLPTVLTESFLFPPYNTIHVSSLRYVTCLKLWGLPGTKTSVDRSLTVLYSSLNPHIIDYSSFLSRRPNLPFPLRE